MSSTGDDDWNRTETGGPKEHWGDSHDVVDRARSRLRRDKEARFSRLRALAGTAFDEMVTSRAATLRMLQDSDPKRRAAALWLVATHWKPQGGDEVMLEQYLVGESDAEVQAAAITALTILLKGTKEQRVSRLFAEIIRDQTRSIVLRRGAYVGLMNIQGHEIPQQNLLALARCKNELPGDIEWSIVESFSGGRL